MERVARYYTPAIIVLATLVASVPTAMARDWDQAKGWLYLACSLLVAGCPCALVLSTPATVVSGLAAAANNGCLVKGGQVLETLAAMTRVALDKTGTLTEGKYRAVGIVAAEGQGEAELLGWLASIEAQSSHPIAWAVTKLARERRVPFGARAARGYKTLPGEGIAATVAGREVVVGNLKVARRMGWTAADARLVAQFESWEEQGHTACFVGVAGGAALGVFAVADEIRPEAEALLVQLSKSRIKPVMLTGDNRSAALKVAAKIGLGSCCVKAGLSPEDKLFLVSDLKAKAVAEGRKRSKCFPLGWCLCRGGGGGKVGMVGDGVNDGPALAMADVGIAMGAAGTPVAMETADVVLFSDNLAKLADAVRLARTCRRTIAQNIALSIAIKVAVIALTFTRRIGLLAVVLSDVLGALLVIANGLAVMADAKSLRRRARLWATKLRGRGAAQATCEKKCCGGGARSGGEGERM